MSNVIQDYYSLEANNKYMSNSQYKDFMDCEAMAIAVLKGEWVREQTIEQLVGSYVHAWNEGILPEFKATHPEMFKKNGEPYAQFALADQMIKALQNDSMCMYMLEGQKEVSMAAEMFGCLWKIKIDTLKAADSIIDLKTTKSIHELSWNPLYRAKLSFIENYNYWRQFAIYLEVEKRATGRENWLTPYIVAVSKETPPDKAVIALDNEERLHDELEQIEINLPRILQVKTGEAQPTRCEKCAYCRATKKVTDIISYRDLEEAI